MLTAELVNARKVGAQLRLVRLDGAGRARAAVLAETFLELARRHQGMRREELEEAWGAVVTDPRERKLADGLLKLVEDACEFDAETAIEPEPLRRELFLVAAAARRGQDFARESVLGAVAAGRGVAVGDLERALFADLRGEHRLRGVASLTADALVERYELGQAQAVLLRAVRLSVTLECSLPGAYRAIFRKLKFLRLLYRLQRRPEGGYLLEIDGPYALFDSVTKYGLQLALALPAIRECDRWGLTAEVRWGRDREPLSFALEGGKRGGEGGGEPVGRGRRPARTQSVPLPDDVRKLVDGIRALATSWRVAPATAILDLPGVGLCVPDLTFESSEPGRPPVHLEVLGYWSRDAVWRRVELVQRGLSTPILFAVGQHLRVSEDALGEDLPGALYVYKRTMNPRAVLDRVEQLAHS